MNQIPLSFAVAYNGLIKGRSGSENLTGEFNILFRGRKPDDTYAYDEQRVSHFTGGSEGVTANLREGFLRASEEEIVSRIKSLELCETEKNVRRFHDFLEREIIIDAEKKNLLDLCLSENRYNEYIALAIRFSLLNKARKREGLTPGILDKLRKLSEDSPAAPAASSPAEKSFRLSPEEARQYPFSREYYNLFVIADESFESDRFLVPHGKALTEYIDPKIKAEYAFLKPEAVENIKKFPSLFIQEREEYEDPLDHEMLYSGIVTDVRIQQYGIAVFWKRIGSFFLKDLYGLLPDLCIAWKPTISELNFTHWTVKKMDLIGAMREANMDFFRS